MYDEIDTGKQIIFDRLSQNDQNNPLLAPARQQDAQLFSLCDERVLRIGEVFHGQHDLNP
jgi:erythromycin esterase-like protein